MKIREIQNLVESQEITEQYPTGHPQCLKEGELGSKKYRCTREKNHFGPHVAHSVYGEAAIIWG